MECTEVLNGLLDFNKQLEILVPKPGKELLQIPRKPLTKKTDVFPVFMPSVKILILNVLLI
jgi:hypothetical protein